MLTHYNWGGGGVKIIVRDSTVGVGEVLANLWHKKNSLSFIPKIPHTNLATPLKTRKNYICEGYLTPRE